jgi:subtilisin family serine protease
MVCSRRNCLAVALLIGFISGNARADQKMAHGFFVKTSQEKLFTTNRYALGIQSVTTFKNIPDLVYVQPKSEKNADQLMVGISQMPGVEYVSGNFRRSINDGFDPGYVYGEEGVSALAGKGAIPAPVEKPAPPTEWKNDPRRASNYATGMSNSMYVWTNHTLGSLDMIIADIDTGVDYNHRDLASNMWHNSGEEGVDASGNDKRTNGIDDDGDGLVDDYIGWDYVHNTNLPYDDHGHGTHTSGIAAAVGGNGWGISGVCPRCSIMALKFISADGWGDDLGAVKAIDFAIGHGAKILNCSWGGSDPAPESTLA